MLLLRVRWLYHPLGDPAPFTEQFACSWCAISESRYWEARKYLMRQGILRPAGRVPEQRNMRLFQLATYTPITPGELARPFGPPDFEEVEYE